LTVCVGTVVQTAGIESLQYVLNAWPTNGKAAAIPQFMRRVRKCTSDSGLQASGTPADEAESALFEVQPPITGIGGHFAGTTKT
jgi:hypothetical protein